MSERPLPGGSCDCHTHVIGPQAAYPMDPQRQYTPALATHEQLQAHMDRLGLQRVVIVQPSVYGTDNRCLLDALDRFNGRARGVAVIEATTGAEELRVLHDAGVRGLRINHESSGKADASGLVDALRAWAGRIRGLPWHLQVYAGLDSIADAAGQLGDLGLPVVFDHFAMAPVGMAPDDPRLEKLLQLMRDGVAYVKLSAAYRIGADGPGIRALARTFLGANPQHVVWASDWPHTNRDPGKGPLETSTYRDIQPALLAGQIRDWTDSGQLQAVMVDNPARLYGFD